MKEIFKQRIRNEYYSENTRSSVFGLRSTIPGLTSPQQGIQHHLSGLRTAQVASESTACSQSFRIRYLITYTLHSKPYTPLLLNIGKGSLALALFLVLFSSCVPNKKLVYLQDQQAKEKEYPRDSIIKAYDDQYRQYRLKENDIISLRIGSLTPEEYNFVKQYETQLGLIRKLDQYNRGSQGDNLSNQRLFNQAGGGGGQEGGGISSIMLDRLTTGFILDDFGRLEMPQLGYVELTGLTLDEAEDKIQSLLIEGKLFETPLVRIQLLSFQFSILGEVEGQGRYTTFDPKTDIFDAILLAGSLTEFADRANIKIIRKVGGESFVIYVNTLDQNFLSANNLYLYPDDMIIVPPLKARYWRQYVLPDARTTLGIISTALSLFVLVLTLRNL